MINGIIFDVDGTLLDTERINIRAWIEAGRRLGYSIPESLMRRTRAMEKERVGIVMQEELGMDFPYKECRKLRLEIGEEMIAKEPNLLKPGVSNLMAYLKYTPVMLSIATSTAMDRTKKHLIQSGLDSLIPVQITTEMVAHGKPWPDVFLKAAETMGVAPQECLVVEDSASGIRAAHAAGMASTLIPDLAIVDEETRKMATIILERIDELIPFLVKGTLGVNPTQ